MPKGSLGLSAAAQRLLMVIIDGPHWLGGTRTTLGDADSVGGSRLRVKVVETASREASDGDAVTGVQGVGWYKKSWRYLEVL